MTARFIVADVFDGLAQLEDGAVDLVVTSPPFLALRSYLPADHPDKGKEIGSEATPAEFLDTLLAVTAELRRVLAPHGSIAVELGDTYAGSGGAGGDYGEDGLREGQPKFKANPGRNSGTRYQKPGMPSIPAREYGDQLPTKGDGWPLAKSVCMIPEAYRFALAYGFNPFTGSPSPAGKWRVRNKVTWCRPNPPVGALGDKWRPATSDVVVACVSPKRYWDDLATRKPFAEATLERTKPGSASHNINSSDGTKDNTTEMGVRVPAMMTHSGAPLLDYWQPPMDMTIREAIDAGWLDTGDYWEIPPGGYQGAHYAVFPPALVEPLVKAMGPQKVCLTCGEPSRRVHEHLGRDRYAERPDPKEFGRNLSDAMDETGISVDYLAEQVGVTPWMVRHWRAETRTPQVPSIKRWDQIAEVLGELGDWAKKMRVVSAEYGTPDRGNREIPERLSGGPLNGDKPKVVATGWTDCGHDNYRPGIVLDPFAGSGTTLAVATGHGLDAIGIDIDQRNAELTTERVGPFLMEVVE